MMKLPGFKNAGLISLAAAFVLLAALACGGDGGEKTVTGRVVDLVARDIVEIELLTVRDADSQVWEFTTTGPVGMSFGHLRQHQALAEKIQVTYQKVGGQLIASDVQDAVEANTPVSPTP